MYPSFIRFIPHAILASIAILAIAASLFAARVVALPDGDEYNAAGFVVRHSWAKFGSIAARPFHDDLSRAEEDARLDRFFELNDLIGYNERIAGDPATDAALADEAQARAAEYVDERAQIENSVERILEGRLTDAIKRAGLTRHVGGDIVWPPVSIEFEDTPTVLVTSPRAVIRKDGERLLRGDLPVARAQEIEARAERDGVTSALVVRIGAIATYPAIIPPSADRAGVIEHAAHEWMHHYLAFAPLGRRYNSLTALNETVANMAGRELACMVESCEVSVTAQRGGSAPLPQQYDFAAEMRALRLNVESLLLDGQIQEAERVMEEKRLEINSNGYYIRRLNQAYFAFHGSYADTPASIDPIGPKLQELRESATSLEVFVETARDLRSEAALDAALAD